MGPVPAMFYHYHVCRAFYDSLRSCAEHLRLWIHRRDRSVAWDSNSRLYGLTQALGAIADPATPPHNGATMIIKDPLMVAMPPICNRFGVLIGGIRFDWGGVLFDGRP